MGITVANKLELELFLENREDINGGVDGLVVKIVLKGHAALGSVGPLGDIAGNPALLEARVLGQSPVKRIVVPDNSYTDINSYYFMAYIVGLIQVELTGEAKSLADITDAIVDVSKRRSKVLWRVTGSFLDSELVPFELGNDLLVGQGGHVAVRPAVHGNFVAGFVGTLCKLRVLHDLGADHEERHLLVDLVEVIIQEWAELGRAIVVCDRPGALGAGIYVFGTQTFGECPNAARVALDVGWLHRANARLVLENRGVGDIGILDQFKPFRFRLWHLVAFGEAGKCSVCRQCKESSSSKGFDEHCGELLWREGVIGRSSSSKEW